MSNFSSLLRLLTPCWPALAGRARWVVLVLLLAAPLLGRAQYQVQTLAPTNITVNSATLGAQATNAGAPTRPSGVAYRQGAGLPTTADMVVSLALVPTNPCQTCYTGTAPLLQPGTLYAARAYIVTPSGTTYGDTQTFETPPAAYQPPLPAISLTPAGPLVLGAGSTITLTASLTLPGFNLTGTGLNGEVTAVLVQPDGKVLVGGSFTTHNNNPAAPARLLRFLPDNSLDLTFNPGGAGPNGAVRALALQPDGKVLVGGEFTTYNGAPAPGRVLRLGADGSLDATFNTPNGQPGAGPNASPGNFAGNTGVAALALQPDGKVLVGGGFTTYNGAPAPGRVLRLNADGSLDGTFNTPSGQPGAGPNNNVTTLVLQPDGKVLVGGQFTAYNADASAPDRVLRLNADGSLDTGFNNNGTGLDSGVRALLLQSDGKVLVGGAFTSYNTNANAPDRVLRLNADGSLDTGFNNGPAAGTSVADGVAKPAPVNALALQPDGKVVVGGLFTLYNGNADAPDNLLRLNADGSLDTGFNNGPAAGASGDLIIPGVVSQPAAVNALALQPGGQVLAGGLFFLYNGSADAPNHLLRLAPDGSLDASYAVVTTAPGLTYTWSTGATGPTLTVSQPGDYRVTATRQGRTYYSRLVRVNAPPAVAVQVAPGGPLVLPASGSATLTATATRPGFNVGGAGFNSDVLAVLVQPDGKVLVGGRFSQYNGTPVPALARLNPDGSLDASFNPAIADAGRTVYALALQPDGKVLVGGDLQGFTYSSGVYPVVITPITTGNLLRLNADGSLDASFSVGSFDKVAVGGPPSQGPYYHVYALALQPDGKIVVGGKFDTFNGTPCRRNLERLNPDGSLDVAFNSGGSGSFFDWLSGGLGVHDDWQFVAALLALPNGKILVGGHFNFYNGLRNTGRRSGNSLMRLNDDGTRDTSFNLGNDYYGVIEPTMPEEAGMVYALALQPDGKILVGGGFTEYNSPFSTYGGYVLANRLVRLHENGFPDTSFDPPSDAVTSWTDQKGLSPVRALAVQPDGKIVVGGDFTVHKNSLVINNQSSPQYNRTYLLRLEPNGILDPATDFSHPAGQFGADQPVYALAVQPDGQVLAGGAFTAYNGNAAAPDGLLRLTPAGALNDAATPLAGATYAFNPGSTSGNTRSVSQPGTYTATATDPATGFSYLSNPVVVTGAPLPVELTQFTATLVDKAAVRLAWATASEKNSASFEVERSLDGRTFARIGTVAAAGSSSAPRRYELLDGQLPAGARLLYYRLRQVDLDGTFSYSPVRTVALSGAVAGLALYPNPAHGGAATLTGAQPGTVVTVFDALGREVTHAPADASGTAALALPAGLSAGVYVVRAGSKAVRLTVE